MGKVAGDIRRDCASRPARVMRGCRPRSPCSHAACASCGARVVDGVQADTAARVVHDRGVRDERRAPCAFKDDGGDARAALGRVSMRARAGARVQLARLLERVVGRHVVVGRSDAHVRLEVIAAFVHVEHFLQALGRRLDVIVGQRPRRKRLCNTRLEDGTHAEAALCDVGSVLRGRKLDGLGSRIGERVLLGEPLRELARG